MARMLIDAILNGDESLALTLIQNGTYGCVDSQTARRDGTALFFSCSLGYLDIAIHLINRGASVNSQTKSLSTPLHAAADRGYVDIVRLLLQQGADVNCKNDRGDTPLHLAAYRGHIGVIYCLVHHGADILALNSLMITAQNEARCQGHEQLATFLLQEERAQNLCPESPGPPSTMLSLNPPTDFIINSGPAVPKPDEHRHPPATATSFLQHPECDVKFPPSRRRHSHTACSSSNRDFHNYDSVVMPPKVGRDAGRIPMESTWADPTSCPRRPSLCSTGSDSVSSDVSQGDSRREVEENWISTSPSPVSDNDCPRRQLSGVTPTQTPSNTVTNRQHLNCPPNHSSYMSVSSTNSTTGSSSNSSSIQHCNHSNQHNYHHHHNHQPTVFSPSSSLGHFSVDLISNISMPSWSSMDPPSSSDLSSAMSTGSDEVMSSITSSSFPSSSSSGSSSSSSSMQQYPKGKSTNLSLTSPRENLMNSLRVPLTRAVSVHGQSEPSQLRPNVNMMPLRSRTLAPLMDPNPVNDLSSLSPSSTSGPSSNFLSSGSRDKAMTFVNIQLT